MLPIADLTILQGATWALPGDWKTDEETPVPVDLTGYTARMMIRKANHDGRTLIELTTENERIVFTNPTAGEFELSLSATETAALFPGVHVYDLEFVSGETVTRLLQGHITVDAEVTRP